MTPSGAATEVASTTPSAGSGGEQAPSLFTWDRNSTVHLVFLLMTAATVGLTGWWGLLLYPALHLASDVLYYRFAVDVFDPSVTIERGYTVSLVYLDNPHSEGIDYGFNFYDGDYTKTREQAQRDKFDHAWDALALQPGMRLIDIGCGCGDWLDYLRDRGVHGVGVNITAAQVDVCRSRGLEVHHSDWKAIRGNDELREALFGTFDRVTFWDTVEHYVPMKYRTNLVERDAIYRSLFELTDDLLRGDDGRVFISCLHMRRNFSELRPTFETLRKASYTYILDKFHSGTYPEVGLDCLVRNARDRFELASRKDCTLDYYMTSRLEKTHFGRHHFEWTRRRVAYALWSVLADPFWFHRLLWFVTEDWMYQFDEDDIDQSDVLLWWLVLRSRRQVDR